MIKYFSIFFLGLVLMTGCNVINPPEQVPTYVHIDSFKFINSDPGAYGSSSHAINTVFATYNGIEIGVFDLPCNIPVLATGSGQLILEPGIEVNGFNDQESPYPFYTDAFDTLVAQPGKVINLTPTTGYVANTELLLNVTFDAGSNFSNYSGTVNLVPITAPVSSVFEGNGSGIMNFTTNDSAECFNLQTLTIPTNSPVLCELNYKSNIPIAVGLIPVSGSFTTSPQYNNLAFAPSADWQKIYINLAELVSVFPADNYTLVIKAAVPPGQANGYALFDNIKVVIPKQ